MTSNKCRAILLGLIVGVGTPGAASAGALGPTSRGAVSISVTIMPRVRIAAPAASLPRSLGEASPLCVTGTGLGAYRVRFLDETAQRSQAEPPSDLAAACAKPAPANEPFAPSDRPRERSAPLTLLVVPD